MNASSLRLVCRSTFSLSSLLQSCDNVSFLLIDDLVEGLASLLRT